MSIRTLLITGIAAIVVSGPAFAADLAPAPIEPQPVVMPLAYDWTGFYVGAQVGYAWGSLDTDAAFLPDPDTDGVVGGAHIGYNAQFNQIVVGLEGDIEASGMGGDERIGDFTVNADNNWQGSVRARLGYAFDNVLPYVTGGVAFSDWDFTLREAGVAGRVEESDTLTGWTVGAGIEYGFTQNITARLEYRYTDFGSSDFNADDGDADLTSNAVRVGVSYKF